MTPSQRPHRSSLLRRLLYLLLIQHLAASRLQLRTHLHKGLWHPEDEEENQNERLADLKEPGIELPEHDAPLCESSPSFRDQVVITE